MFLTVFLPIKLMNLSPVITSEPLYVCVSRGREGRGDRVSLKTPS
jgi:hypothetical protein